MGLDSLTPENNGLKKAKHIMEKRRRARINASLAELKCLLPGGGRQGTCSIKMEKADILERAVEHLKLLTAQCYSQDDEDVQSLCGSYHSPRDRLIENYDRGYRECLDDVDSYLLRMRIDDSQMRAHILRHLASRKARLTAAIRGKSGSGTTVKRCGALPVRDRIEVKSKRGSLDLSSYHPTHSPADSTTPEDANFTEVEEMETEEATDLSKGEKNDGEMNRDDNNNNETAAQGLTLPDQAQSLRLDVSETTGSRSGGTEAIGQNQTLNPGHGIVDRPKRQTNENIFIGANLDQAGSGAVSADYVRNRDKSIASEQEETFHNVQNLSPGQPHRSSYRDTGNNNDGLPVGSNRPKHCSGVHAVPGPSVPTNAIRPQLASGSSKPVSLSKQLSIVIPASFLSTGLLRPCLIPVDKTPHCQLAFIGSKAALVSDDKRVTRQPPVTVRADVITSGGSKTSPAQEAKQTSTLTKPSLLVTQLCQPVQTTSVVQGKPAAAAVVEKPKPLQKVQTEMTVRNMNKVTVDQNKAAFVSAHELRRCDQSFKNETQRNEGIPSDSHFTSSSHMWRPW